jgi:hypothetical protein
MNLILLCLVLFSAHHLLAFLLDFLKDNKGKGPEFRAYITAAIAVVAKTCSLSLSTILPDLMKSYSKFLDIASGPMHAEPYGFLLEIFSPLFEHIGQMDKDDISAVTPLLKQVLNERCV